MSDFDLNTPNPAPDADLPTPSPSDSLSPPILEMEAPPIENLSVAHLIGLLAVRPRATLRALGDLRDRSRDESVSDSFATSRISVPAPISAARTRSATAAQTASASASSTRAMAASLAVDGGQIRPLLAMCGALAITVIGGAYMLRKGVLRTESDIPVGLFVMIIGAFLFAVTQALTALGAAAMPRLPTLIEEPDRKLKNLDDFFGRYGLRLALIGTSAVFSGGAWLFTVNNTFTAVGVFCWLFSIFGWALALAPEIFPDAWLGRAVRALGSLPGRVLSFHVSWTLIALIGILIAGAYFRFSDLSSYPPDMTSDHVEKALDSQLIAEGARPVFLANNGGREVIQFYTLALLHNVLNVPINFDLLKILTGIEGLLGILAVWWLGREMIGAENPELGNLTGLIMAALLAFSYWDVLLSRLGLRIVLTPLATAILLIFFVRALRYNRRADFVRAGLALGIGLYTYQAMRMSPVFWVIGIILAIALRARSWLALRRYVLNFVALVIVAVAVFIPLGHYMSQFPNEFWARTTGRLFGEDSISVPDPATGATVTRAATTADRIDALKTNLGYLGSNMGRALFMFNWKGDTAWVSGAAASGAPQMNLLAGGLLFLGAGAWLVRMVRRRDPADWLIPFGLLVMLLPTALSLAYTIEVPSSTRASGAIPFAYLLAGFAAALIVQAGWSALRGSLPRLAVIGAVATLALLAASADHYTYFNDAIPQYRLSTLPHHQAGQILKGFMNSTGAPGNAFMIAYDFWWDHRALAIEADNIHWNNGIIRDNFVQRIVQMIQSNAGTPYAFRPDRQMLFFVNGIDQQTLDGLKAWLPNITIEKITSFAPQKDFMLVIAPPVGCDWLNQNVPGVDSPVCKGGS